MQVNMGQDFDLWQARRRTLSLHPFVELAKLGDYGGEAGRCASICNEVVPQQRHIHRHRDDAGPAPALLCEGR